MLKKVLQVEIIWYLKNPKSCKEKWNSSEMVKILIKYIVLFICFKWINWHSKAKIKSEFILFVKVICTPEKGRWEKVKVYYSKVSILYVKKPITGS